MRKVGLNGENNPYQVLPMGFEALAVHRFVKERVNAWIHGIRGIRRIPSIGDKATTW